MGGFMNLKNNHIQYFIVLVLSLGFYTGHTQTLPSCAPQPVITLFSHGVADSYKQAFMYAKSYIQHGTTHCNERYLFHTPYVTFNYPDATSKFYRVNWNETSFGQENEIARLHCAYQHTMKQFENCDIILWGLSRGASNQSIFAGMYPLDNVKAIVLESPYNCMAEVIA